MLDAVVSELEPGPDRARALINLARVRSYDDGIRAAEPLFRQALDEAGDDNELLAAAGLNVASILFRLRERLEEAVEHASTAVRAASSAGATGWLGESLGAKLLPEAALGRRAEAAATLESALAAQPSCEDRRAMAQPLFQVSVVWLWWDELERAKEGFEWLLARAREMGDEGSLPYILVLAAQVECVRGDLRWPPPTPTRATSSRSRPARPRSVPTCLRCAPSRTHWRETCRRPASALSAPWRWRSDTSGRPAEHFALAALGEAELSRRPGGRGRRALGPLVAFLRREQISEPGAARVVPNQVEALIALGELEQASELLDWYSQNAKQLGRRSALAAAARCRGLLRAELGDLEEALELLESAVDLERRSSDPLGARPGAPRPGRRAPARQAQASGARVAGGGAGALRRDGRTRLGGAGARGAWLAWAGAPFHG